MPEANPLSVLFSGMRLAVLRPTCNSTEAAHDGEACAVCKRFLLLAAVAPEPVFTRAFCRLKDASAGAASWIAVPAATRYPSSDPMRSDIRRPPNDYTGEVKRPVLLQTPFRSPGRRACLGLPAL